MAENAANPKGGRRQQQKEQTRVLILEAARDLFEAKGFAGTTMRAVASRAGVALGTIFTHFDDKGALLLAAVLEDLSHTDQQIADGFPAHAGIRDQIMHVAAGGYGYWCSRPALSAELLREMYFIDGPWAQTRQQETARFLDYVAGLLSQGQQRGEIRPDIEPRRIAEALYSFYVGTLIRAAGNNRFELDQLLQETRTFFDQLMQGIGAPHI
jgi:AcrR family transcriptional regulator